MNYLDNPPQAVQIQHRDRQEAPPPAQVQVQGHASPPAIPTYSHLLGTTKSKKDPPPLPQLNYGPSHPSSSYPSSYRQSGGQRSLPFPFDHEKHDDHLPGFGSGFSNFDQTSSTNAGTNAGTSVGTNMGPSGPNAGASGSVGTSPLTGPNNTNYFPVSTSLPHELPPIVHQQQMDWDYYGYNYQGQSQNQGQAQQHQPQAQPPAQAQAQTSQYQNPLHYQHPSYSQSYQLPAYLSNPSFNPNMNAPARPEPDASVGPAGRKPRKHTATVHNMTPQTAARNRCSICQKQFKRPSSLQTHMYSHTGEKLFKCPWPECGKLFLVKSNMTRHHRLHERDMQGEVKRHSESSNASNHTI